MFYSNFFKAVFGLNRNSPSTYRKTTFDERNAIQIQEVAPDIRNIGKGLLTMGMVIMTAQLFVSKTLDLISNGAALIMLGFVIWTIGIFMTGRFVKTSNDAPVTARLVPGSSKPRKRKHNRKRNKS